MKISSAVVHRMRQFLSHARIHGSGSAFRTAGLFFRVRMNSLMRRSGTVPYRDMSWLEFESRFLSRRGIYKGIFVQNVVISWNDSLFQRPQQMALALGRLGYLVIYKTPYPVLDEVVGVRNIAPNVYLTSAEHFDFIEGAVHSTYSTIATHPSDWTERQGFSSCTIYEYVDHIDPKISGNEENIRRLLAGKRFAFGEGGHDFVIASARQLEDEAVEAVGRDKVILVPNGVDVWHYRNPAHERFHLPQELLKFRSEYENVVGYFGAIAPWLWYDEITKLVNSRPDLGFVFIGPDYADAVAKLPKTRNVLRLDRVSYDTLPAYAKQFDVCFIPFEPGEIAHTTSPLKLFEYFALEKPVVVTSRMRECTAFDVVFSGEDAGSLSTAIDEAIESKSDPAFKDELARLADENSWDNRARLLERVFLKASKTVADSGG